mmetsp:Transcript_16018/g.13999  ORF Transcript_16018/g.13999 Transcript_16018/m.13999 type:complete len:98 (+) Transcript_16018:200-493(+)
MNSKIRSKKARDRKKFYIEELEHQVHLLQQENSRLQKLLAIKQNEKLSNTSSESKNLLQKVIDFKQDLFSIFLDSEGKYNENSKISKKEHFVQNGSD